MDDGKEPKVVAQAQTGQFNVQFVLPPAVEVKLLSKQLFPDVVVATTTRGYQNKELSYRITDMPDEEIEQWLNDADRTKLNSPLRFVNFIFLVRNVTRGWTHQMVRYSQGTAFVQESLRFSDKRIAMYLLSPRQASSQVELSSLTETLAGNFAEYAAQLERGVPVEDARGILPTNTLTHMWVSLTLAELAHIYDQRQCCQAQHLEWLDVMAQMKALVPPSVRRFLKAPWETGAVTCGFGASFDRPCKFQDKFDANIAKLLQARGITTVTFDSGQIAPVGELVGALEQQRAQAE